MGLTRSPEPNSMANVAASIAKRFCVSIDGRLASTSSELSAVQSCLHRTEGEILRLLEDPDASPLQVAAGLCHEQARDIGRPHVQVRDGCVNELHSSLLVFLLHHAKDDLLNEARLADSNQKPSKQATQLDANSIRDPRDDTDLQVTRFCNRFALTWQECSSVRTSVEMYGHGVPITSETIFERPVQFSPVVVASPVQPFQQCPATRHSILSALETPTSDDLRTHQTSQLRLLDNSVFWPAILLVLVAFAIVLRKGSNVSKRSRTIKIIDIPAFRELVDVASAYRHASEQYTQQDKVRPEAKLPSTACSTGKSSLVGLSLENHQAFKVIVSRWRFKRMLSSARRIQASWRKARSRSGRLQGSEGIYEGARTPPVACGAAISRGGVEQNSASEVVAQSPEGVFEIEDSERLEEQLNMSSASEYYPFTNSLLDILPSGLPGSQDTHKRLFAMRQQMAIRPVLRLRYSEVVDASQQQPHLLPSTLRSCSTTLAVNDETKKRTRELHDAESSHTSASQPEVHMPPMCSTIGQILDEVPLAESPHSPQAPIVVSPNETGISVEEISDNPSRSSVASSDRGTARLFPTGHSAEVFGANPRNLVAMGSIGSSNTYARRHDYASHTDRAQHSAAWTIYKFVTKTLAKKDASGTSEMAHTSGDSFAQAATTRALKTTKQIVAAARIKSFLLNCKWRQQQGTLINASTSSQSSQESQNSLSASSSPDSTDAHYIDSHERAQQRENMRRSLREEDIRAQTPSYGFDLAQSHQQPRLYTAGNHQAYLSVAPMRSKFAASCIQQCWRRHHKRTLECHHEKAWHFAQLTDDMHGLLGPCMSNGAHVKLEKKAEQLLSSVMYTVFLRWRYLRVRYATICIQRVWRNYRRSSINKRKENAAILIQRSWQRRVMSSQNLEGRDAIDPNRMIRNNEVPSMSYHPCPSDMIGSKSVTPQSIHAFRGLLFRWRFQRVRMAVRRIQRAWRSSRKERCKSPYDKLEIRAVTVGTGHIRKSFCGQGHNRIACFSRQMWEEVVFIASHKLTQVRLQEQSAAMRLQRSWKKYRRAKEKPKRVKLFDHTSSMWWCGGWQEHMQNLHSHLFPSSRMNLLRSSIDQNVRSSECSDTPASDPVLACTIKEASRIHAQPQGLSVERPEQDLDALTLVTPEGNEPMKGNSKERIVVKRTTGEALLAAGLVRYNVGGKHTFNDSVMNNSHISSSLQTAAATLIQRAWREFVCLDNQQREFLADERIKVQRTFYLLKNVHGAAKLVGDQGNREVIGMKAYRGPELHHTDSKVPNLPLERPATLTVCHLTSTEPTFTVDAEDNEYAEPMLDVQKRIAWF